MPEVSDHFRKQWEGYGITTVNIFYRIPDYQSVIQEFVWQEYDIHPAFPRLNKFLDFWEKNIEGPLYSLKIAHQFLISKSEIQLVRSEFKLH